MPDDILIIEDDQNLAVTIQMVLESEGYTCRIARNGREGLDAVAHRMPSLIILDMLMPVMDGWEFGRTFGNKYGHAAPILVLTAAEDARKRGLEIDASSVLAKPFDLSQLLTKIRNLTHPKPSHVPAHDEMSTP